MRTLRFVAILAFVFAFSPSAYATGTVECVGAGEDAEADAAAFLSVGRLPFLSVLGARFELGGQVWFMDGKSVDASAANGATVLLFAQGLANADGISADFADLNAERIVISLRLARSTDGAALAGVMTIAGNQGVALTCVEG